MILIPPRINLRDWTKDMVRTAGAVYVLIGIEIELETYKINGWSKQKKSEAKKLIEKKNKSDEDYLSLIQIATKFYLYAPHDICVYNSLTDFYEELE